MTWPARRNVVSQSPRRGVPAPGRSTPCHGLPMNTETLLLVSREPFLEPILRHLLPPSIRVLHCAWQEEALDMLDQPHLRLTVLDLPEVDEHAPTAVRQLYQASGK